MWRNWAGNQSMQPVAIERPGGAADVAELVAQAAAAGRRIKAIGSGHSFTDIGLTDGVLLSLDRMNRVLSIDVPNAQVTVQAGMTLRRLNAELAVHGLGLTNMGDIDAQTVAGAISTGTHGTGRDSAALATQVVGLELVLADGTVLTCSAHEHPDVFAASRVGLGALGIVTAVTVQAEPGFLLHAEERPAPLEEILDGFEEFASHEHAEFFWFPHTTVALTKRNHRVAGPATPPSWARRLLEDEVLGNGVFGALCRLGKAAPSLIPRLNTVTARSLGARSYSAAAPAVFTSPRRVRFCEMEYAVPRSELSAVIREVRHLITRLDLRISFPVEVRVAPADDITLSTASGRETAYVAVHVFRGTDYRPYFDAVEAVMTAVSGRPHWGKLHGLAAPQLRERYPRFAEFTALRDRLDPSRLFGNAYLTRTLGD